MSNLALTLRPDSLDSFLGGDHIKKALKSFADKDDWPNVILFYGPPGTGKTTLALIVAKLAGAQDDGLREVNASADNGVDAARGWADLSSTRPFSGQRRVIILNEFDQATQPAQKSLKDPMEKNSTIWILTTQYINKIEPAILSRASAATFELKPLARSGISALVERALGSAKSELEKKNLTDSLIECEVFSPREILGVLDLTNAGVPFQEAVHGSEHEPLYPEIAKATLSGNWTKTAGLLKQVPTADYRAMVAVVSAKLSWALLDESIGPRGDSLATCLVGLGANQFADGVAYSSLKGLLYKACRALGAK